MGATSVTGTGKGDAGDAKYKPENHCGGCGCCGECDEPDPPPKIKRGCYTRSRTGGYSSHVGNGGTNIRVC